ncbi:MAG: TonB-dependent receptor [Muribaculaceae bacterium]|nr:TonB-dependent receptor [Muribaculaceae bacterium]
MKNTFYNLNRKLWLTIALVLGIALPGFAQKITVHGYVDDEHGEPLIGATVMEKGTTNGTATDLDGNFTLTVAPNATLVVSYVGYDPQEVAVNGQTELKVTMAENATMLQETVVIGYGTVKKSDATGSVSVVKPSEIEAGLATSAQDLLVGASPGVVVTTNGGSPQGDASIIIRGGASLAASNEPLIVIDGVPMERGSVKGSSNPLSLVSPDNVESMTILKSASATAIYGSRASNGVIIITTKKGKSGRPQVNFAANMYVNTPRNYMDMMDGNQFAGFVRDYYGADSPQAGALGIDGNIYNTDWQKEVLRTSVSSDYNLSVGGTAGWLPYRVAASYTNNNGVIRTSKMDRVTLGINLNPSFFDNTLKINASLKGAYIANRYNGDGLGGAVSFNPTLPVRMPGGNHYNNYVTYMENGTLATMDTPAGRPNTLAALNPVASINDYSSKSQVYQSVGNIQFDYTLPFFPDLKANLNLGYEYNHGECTNYNFPFSPVAWKEGHYVAGSDDPVYDGYTNKGKEFQERYNLLLDFFLNYNKEFEAIHSSLDVTAGYSWQKFRDNQHNYSYVNAPGEPFDKYQRSATWYGSTPYQLVSFFGRVNYGYKDRYLVTVTLRGDATSRFSKENRWGVFPAVALAWRAIEEPFMDPVRNVFSDLKLRLDYGQTGQQDLGVYFPYLPTYNVSNDLNGRYPIGGQDQFLVTPGWYNADLKWETTTTYNVGLDFGFLNNRINGSIDWYLRKTKDLLTYANFPAGSNLSNMGNLNLGDLENYGVEFNLVTRPVVNQDFQWTSSLNVAWNKNKVTRLAEGADTSTGGIGNGVNIMKHQEGYPAYSYWVYEQVYNPDGTPLEGVYVDRNGDGEITEADKYLYHSKDPSVTLNWQNTFNYKNWDFGIVLRASFGNWLYNANQMNNSFISATSNAPLSNLMDNVYLWNMTRDTQVRSSDYFVRNASFLRCDNISVGYTWPGLFNDTMRLRLYGAVQNPFVITKYKGLDPEVGSGIDSNVYPRPVTFTLGIVAQF